MQRCSRQQAVRLREPNPSALTLDTISWALDSMVQDLHSIWIHQTFISLAGQPPGAQFISHLRTCTSCL